MFVDLCTFSSFENICSRDCCMFEMNISRPSSCSCWCVCGAFKGLKLLLLRLFEDYAFPSFISIIK